MLLNSKIGSIEVKFTARSAEEVKALNDYLCSHLASVQDEVPFDKLVSTLQVGENVVSVSFAKK